MNMAGSVEHLKSLSNTLVKVGLSDECGCPEEEWIIGQLHTIIHMEPDTGGHIFIDCGDWDDEKLVECNTMEELRMKAVEWCDSFPINNEL
ncbi:MAG: hypothetical protein CBC55_04935 [Gammaproteobacteria bacterium TMED95]|nr:MAG: hypothetical protein CBC55_04935 [Gammaproteobacteria bacterium TMED95]|tara:strand:+ start:3346 stop:3618 length:273 start_codon:yes stop_codon:yes gene_type:complete